MIAHVAIRRTQVGGAWLHAHGWVAGASTGAGLATSRAEAIRNGCVDALSVGATGIALPAVRDYPAALEMTADPLRLHLHEDPAAVAVALRAASLKLMRECIRRHGMPDLGGDHRAVIEQLGGPETVAAVIGCDAAQVVRWSKRGMPEVRIQALRREIAALGVKCA